MIEGFGEGKGLKVVTKAVNGVVAGKELWFPNTGHRLENGITRTDHYTPGTGGFYWLSNTSSSTAYYFWFDAGHITYLGDYSKLWALSVRCVR